MYTYAKIGYSTYYTHYFQNDLLSKTKNFALKIQFDIYSCTIYGKFSTQVAVVHHMMGHKTIAIQTMLTLNSKLCIVLNILQIPPTTLSSSEEAMYLFTGDAQTLQTTWLWVLNFVQPCPSFVDPQYGTCCMSPFWHLEF